jgi:hypothetical protein
MQEDWKLLEKNHLPLRNGENESTNSVPGNGNGAI